ncbi:hypothetical protein B0H21DRAFT_732759 [Amylocystis lapponica]|nr:hypothetical protein B0H21DRAFT_732759 [Amylocystis lapponica]
MPRPTKRALVLPILNASNASTKKAKTAPSKRRRAPKRPPVAPERSPERVQFLVEKCALYDYTVTKHAYVLGPENGRQDVNPVHNEAIAEFCADPSNPLIIPPLGDPKVEAEWLGRCDELCRRQPIRLQDFYTANFASMAGLQYLSEREFMHMSHKLFHEIMKAAHAIVMKRLEDEGVMTKTTYRPRFSRAPRNPDGDDLVGPYLVGQKIRYLNDRTGKIIELTVQGYEPDHDGVSYFDVAYSDGEQKRLTVKDMDDLLVYRIP